MILSVACEGVKHSASTLIDAETKKPVAGANIYFLDKKNKVQRSTVTDSTGTVIFDSGFTGMNFGGPKFKYKICKKGYKVISGNEKFPAAELLFEPLPQHNTSLFIKQWHVSDGKCILPVEAKTISFGLSSSGDESCIWSFKPDSTLHLSCSGKYDGIYARGGKWEVSNDTLWIKDRIFRILTLSDTELKLEAINTNSTLKK